MWNRIKDKLQPSKLEEKKKLLWGILAGIMIAGLFLRILLLIHMPGDFFHNDGKEYHDISHQILSGNGFSVSFYRWYEAVPDVPEPFHPDFSRPPVFPLLGAALGLLPFDWFLSAKITVLLISLLCSFSVYLLGKEVCSSRLCGVLAAGIYTFYPYSIYHTICWSTENLFLLFLCVSYFFLIRCVRKGFSCREGFFCGIFLSAASLTRPQGGLLVLLLGFSAGILFLSALIRKDRQQMKRIFSGTFCFGIGFLFLVSPWMIRNYRAAGIPEPFSFYGPYSFAQSASEITYATFRYVDTPDYKQQVDLAWETYHREKRDQLKAMQLFSLPEANPFWKKWAWEYIRENPEKVMENTVRKVIHCFRAAPNSAAISQMKYRLIQCYFFPMVLLMLLGICALKKTDKTALLLLTMPFGAVILFAIFFQMMLRYRYPFFAPFAGILAAYGILFLLKRMEQKSSAQGAIET